MIPRSVQIAITLMLAGVLAGGIYMVNLKNREARNAQRAADSRPLSAPLGGPTSKIVLAVAYDEDGVLRKQEARAAVPEEPGERAREILRVLLSEYMQKPSSHPMAAGSDVKEIFLLPGGLCVVDLNSALVEGHRSGIFLEQLTLASMVETLAFNMPEIHRVKFLVEGKERETLAGHADLSMAYDVPAVHKLVEELR